MDNILLCCLSSHRVGAIKLLYAELQALGTCNIVLLIDHSLIGRFSNWFDGPANCIAIRLTTIRKVSLRQGECIRGEGRESDVSLVDGGGFRARMILFAKIVIGSVIFKWKLRSLFRLKKIDYVFIEGDREPVFGLLIIQVARRLGCVVGIPYLANFASVDRLLMSKKVATGSVVKFISKYFYPVNLINNVDFYSIEILIWGLLFRCLPANPWVMGSGGCDCLFVANEIEKEHYVTGGVGSKVIVAGDPQVDICRDAREKLPLGRNSSQRVIVAIPQLFEHKLCCLETQIAMTSEMFTLASEIADGPFVVSFHPKANLKLYEDVLGKFDCEVLHSDLVNVLNDADLLIAGYSTTVMWAIELGKQSLIWDYTGLGWNLFDDYGLSIIHGPILPSDWSRFVNKVDLSCKFDVHPERAVKMMLRSMKQKKEITACL